MYIYSLLSHKIHFKNKFNMDHSL